MDTLAKAKVIAMRDFLVEVLITGTINRDSMVYLVKLHQAKEAGLIQYPLHDIKLLELSTKGHAYIHEHEGLV